MRSTRLTVVFGVGLLSMLLTQCGGASQETTAPDGADWPMYRRDLAGTGYSPLTQITTDNAANLTEAWTYSVVAEASDGGSGPRSQVTPIVVDGVMYLPAADRVVALDPATRAVRSGGIRSPTARRRDVVCPIGLAMTRTPARIIVTSSERRLLALDAATGASIESFGQGGETDMGVPYNSVPLVYGDIVVVGANTPRGAPRRRRQRPRLRCARTGDKVWEFSSVPQPGEPGHDTWEGDSWRDRLGVNAWPFYFSMDEERGPAVSATGVTHSGRLRR